METLYIIEDKCSVRREGSHLKLMRLGETIGTVPLVGVKTIVAFDTVSITAPALDLLMANGIDVIYQSQWGKVKGRFIAANGGGVITRLAQYTAFMDTKRRLEIVKPIIEAKISNQLTVIRKYKYRDATDDYDKSISVMEASIKNLFAAQQIDEIMGIEGIAAKHYWSCFKQLLKNPDFTRREYRPSPDYVNALLNLGYAFLHNEITTCLLAKNLDLEIGFLHSIHYSRNSLSLDIMEEFRAAFVDSWVLTALNKNQVKKENFHMIEDDWRMTDEGFHKFCQLYHKRISPWREKFQKQADKLKDSLVKGGEYEPYIE
ncbi:MAG: CRISPR-associated endonuclease Cas1 [Oscillospiraceae bacterium]|nr:CRISPR-associated endonuclease Cas1 [Oscillospiraceae bacterium]